MVFAIPIHVMQYALLPYSTCSKLDSMNRKFLLGAVENRNVFPCSWDQICKSKSMGGLGLRYASLSNLSSMAKVGWDLIHDEKELWVRVLRSKYKCGSDIIP